jgi:biotin carboxylase
MNPQALILHESGPHPRPELAAVRTSGRVAIVDPYSTGEYLASAFARRGVEAVAVLAVPPPPERAGRLPAEQYAAVITYKENPEEVAAQLRELGVCRVLAGTESGVPVADHLASLIGAPGNNPLTSTARRDKFAMATALGVAGVAHARTMTAFSAGAARNVAYELGTWPVVVKPVDSAGSDRVVIARDVAEVSAAANEILGASNLFGRHNEAVIVQQYLRGEQYAVNSVSQRGVHRVVEVWHDRRTPLGDGRMVYDRMDLLSPADPLVAVLCDYVRACLDALGVAYGPAHSEVMLTSAGPVLIETGARLQGGDSVALQREATGTSQTDAAVQAALDTARAHSARAHQPYPYAPVTQMFLQAPADGWIDADALKALLEIPGVAGCVHAPEPGAAVRRTVDLLSSPATVYLAGANARQVDEAHAAVRALEAAGLYSGRGR